MSDPVPPVLGVVTAVIEPIKANKLRFGNLGKAMSTAIGAALRYPQFARTPQLLPGTQARDFAGMPIPGTGIPVPEDVELTAESLTNARDAAERAMARKSRLTAEALGLAQAVCDYQDGGGSVLTKQAARVAAIHMIATIARSTPDPDEVTVDLMNMAYAVLHYGNGEK